MTAAITNLSSSPACESGNLLCIAPPISSTDMKLLEQLGDRGDNISLARVALHGQGGGRGRERGKGKEVEKAKRTGKSADLKQRKIEGKINCMKKKESKVEKVLTGEEKDLWENSTWRSQVKDLNESFSKLPPIFEGNKCGRKGQAFIVKIEQS